MKSYLRNLTPLVFLLSLTTSSLLLKPTTASADATAVTSAAQIVLISTCAKVANEICSCPKAPYVPAGLTCYNYYFYLCIRGDGTSSNGAVEDKD